MYWYGIQAMWLCLGGTLGFLTAALTIGGNKDTDYAQSVDYIRDLLRKLDRASYQNYVLISQRDAIQSILNNEQVIYTPLQPQEEVCPSSSAPSK